MAEESPAVGPDEEEAFRLEVRSLKEPRPEPEGVHAVIWAGGPLGSAVIESLAADSKRIKAILLENSEVRVPEGIELGAADPFKAESIAEACRGAEMIFNCYEPSYESWKKSYGEVTGNISYATIEAGARAVFSSHIVSSPFDNYESESEALNAQGTGLARIAVARLPQLFGERVMNPLFRMIYDAVLEGKKAHWVGDLDVKRSLLDVEDAARAMVLMAGSSQAYGKAWNVASPAALNGREFIELAFRAAGGEPKVGRWSRGISLTGSLLASDVRLVLEMPYDYSGAFTLDGSEFADAFPLFSFTDPEQTMSRAIRWYREGRAAGGTSR